MERGHLHTEKHRGGTMWRDAGRGPHADQSDAATSREMSGTTRSWERPGGISPEVSEGAGCCQHLDPELLASKNMRQSVSVV